MKSITRTKKKANLRIALVTYEILANEVYVLSLPSPPPEKKEIESKNKGVWREEDYKRGG